MKKLLAFVLMLTFAFFLVGCGKDTKPTGVDVTGPTTVGVGGSIQLTATVKPSSAEQKVEWASVDPAIASVDASGKVTGQKKGGTVIRATASNGEYGQIRMEVTEEKTDVYPDLGGYTIKIAHSVPSESNPFHEDYKSSDKEARKEAWEAVEKLYNVKFEVSVYDPMYAWGPPRWDYIVDRASKGQSDFDFVSVPDDRIGFFVESKVLHDTTSWYTQYGEGFLADIYKTSGTYQNKLYSIIDWEAGINNVMYYNVDLVADLIKAGNLTKTPAEMFNEGNWTYSAFRDYAIAAQTGLISKFGADAKDVYAISGYATYYWIGMVNSAGIGLANTLDKTIHFNDPIAQAAAATLKEIGDAKAIRPTPTIDGLINSSMANSFTNGVGIFDSGDMWFVGNSVRWPADMWSKGNAEGTNYGYVPFPRPDGAEYTKENQKIGLGGTATYVMPVGRNEAYKGFGDTNPENIYRAFTETFKRTKAIMESNVDYDKNVEINSFADKKTGSQDSKEALVYMTQNIDSKAFFDPISLPTNPVANIWNHKFAQDLHKFVVGAEGAPVSFAEVISPHLYELQQNLTKGI